MSSDFLEQNGMIKARHPAYSPDVPSSDFYVFGHVKQLLAGQEFPDQGALLDAVQDILRGIEKVGSVSSCLDGKTRAIHYNQWRLR
jgi:hypothetical protein